MSMYNDMYLSQNHIYELSKITDKILNIKEIKALKESKLKNIASEYITFEVLENYLVIYIQKSITKRYRLNDIRKSFDVFFNYLQLFVILKINYFYDVLKYSHDYQEAIEALYD